VTLASTGPNFNESVSVADGALQNGSSQIGAGSENWSATSDAFGQATSFTIANAGGSTTTNLSNLELPTDVSGLVAGTYTNTFNGGVFSSIFTRNSHPVGVSFSPEGDMLGVTGYGVADQTWSTPAIGSTVTQTLTTGVGTAQFTRNLAGTLKQRKFLDGTGETFSYNDAGGMTNWTTPRFSIAITPNQFNEPEHIAVGGDDLADIGYDNAGRPITITDKAGSRTITYVNGKPGLISYTAGVLQGQSVERNYNDQGKLWHVILPGGKTVTYNYGSNGELSDVTTFGGANGTWSNYDAVTGRAKAFGAGMGSAVLTTSSMFDGLGRATGQSSTAGGVTSAYGETYDGDGHCATKSTPDGTWTYGHDGNGYLQTATKSSGPSFTYGFDEAGRPSGATDYRPTVRVNGSTVTVAGSVAPLATVVINGTSVTVDGTTGRFGKSYTPTQNTWQRYDVVGTLSGSGHGGTNAVAEDIRNIFVPPASEPLGYDASGNRAGEARWSYTWNALDQMTQALESNPPPGSQAMIINSTYDFEGRRVERKISHGSDPVRRTITVWDGWKPVMDIDYNAGAEVARRYYTWGPDVSGSLDGAAGIGGLIEIAELKGSVTTHSLPIYDGVGNVVGLVDAGSGARVASYDYGAFGEVLSVYGERASSCPFRFQTKRYDEETGQYYFGKRYYDPKTHTWLSRDPLREDGGVNLYAYCNNDPVGNFDPVGLEENLSEI